MTFRNRFGTSIALAVTVGVAIGFAVPMAMSYQLASLYQPRLLAAPVIIEPLAVVPQPQSTHIDKDSPVARLTARNRRLEALVQTLRRRNLERSRAVMTQPSSTDEVMLRPSK